MTLPKRTRFPILLLLLTAWLGACSPTYNWRETPLAPSALTAMLPCKPDKGARTVPLGGSTVEISMLGCDAGGATFAIAWADLRDPAMLGAALAQWKAASLANIRATASSDTPFAPPGATPLAASVLTTARGQRADGSPVSGQAAYFVHGTQLFQAVIYAGKIEPEAAQTFFSALRLQ